MVEFQIAFPSNSRFDDRRLRIKDDGFDFERFVFEALRMLDDETKEIRAGIGRGRDGAIDLFVHNPNEKLVVECKFIGAGVIDIPEKRWAEVRRHLKDNLGRLIAQDPDSVASSPYAPWLDAKKPIRKYFFCTSVFLPHHQSRILLQQRIHNDFIELSEQCHLPHLASIDVVVYCWNDFHGLLSSQFPLRYRWFGDLPIGIKPLALSLSEVKSFKLFLQEEGMPFFSRSKYLSGNGQPNVQWEEGWIVKLEQNETQAIIIAGAGGLGKTRLGLELSRGLANRGWLCLRLTNNATAERVGELVRAHIEAAKLIFFVDYAEIVDSLREIAEALDRINELQGHELRLIATCRTSALTAVRSDLADLDPIQILLSAEVAPDPQDTSYARWVVENILNYACVPNRAEIARICDGTPALAAFAAFLYQKQHEQFIRQFSNLAGLHDFQTWVNRRLDNLINRLAAAPDRGALNRRLATSIAHLPLPLAERDTITDGSDLERALFEHLEMDGWIELVDGMVLIAHDVFADSILLRYLFQHPSVATQRTRDLMRNSIENGYLDRALHSLGRLADHAVFDTINRYSIIEELKEKDRPGLLSVVDAVMYSRFLLPQDKIVLIGTDEAIRAAAERNEKASLIIGRALESGVDWKEMSGFVLAWLKHCGGSGSAQFVFRSWLNSGGDVESIRSYFMKWIVTSKKSKATSSVYRAWLSAGGEFVAIEDSMRFWIQSFGMTLGAVKIYRMWLVAGGSLDVVRDDVLRWLATFGRTKVSQYAYSAWLQAGGKYEVIGDACERWFERNAESSDAVFLLKYIIRNEYLRGPVVRAAIRWCARFAQLPDTIWRVCSLMGRHGNGPYALAITRSLIVTIRLLDLGRLRLKSTSAQRVEEEEDGSLLAFLLCGALGKALRVSSLDAFDIADLREIHVSLVANTDLYSLVTERGAIPYEGVIVTHVVSLIRSEDLDPARDFAPLQRFAQALVRSSGRDGAGFLQLVSLVPSLGDVGQPAP